MNARGMVGLIKLVVALVIVAVTVITSWILGVRMRSRIKRAIGTEVDNETELTSLNTWMKVEEIEEKKDGAH